MSDSRLETMARWTPVLILAYFAAQFIIRIAFSANLETDEAQFVGHTHLALGYGNSHPPLYNWLVAGALALTGGLWSASLALVKNLLLAGTYLLSFDIARRVTGRALTGLIVVASLLLIPQIVWKSQVTLAHSVLVMFAAVAILHAVVRIVERGDTERGHTGHFIWLGAAAAIGALAKYNLFLLLLAVLIAAFSIPAIRARLFVPRLGISLAVLAALTGPHFVWAYHHLAQSTQRMVKLERENPLFIGIDLPGIGIDGALDLAVALATWAGPLLAAWFAIRHASHPATEPRPAAQPAPSGPPLPAGNVKAQAFAQLFGRIALIGFAIFGVIVLAGDMHSVRERYLTPLLMPLPFWLAFAWPLEPYARAPSRFIGIGATVAALMVTAWPAWITFGREQFAYPYDAFATAIAQAVSGPFAVIAHQDKYAANIAIRVDGASMWGDGDRPAQAVILWDPKIGHAPSGLAARLGDAFEPRGPTMTMVYPYDNLSGEKARLNAQLYARKP